MAIKILVVDDEPLFQKVFNRFFSQQIKMRKYEFHFASNGKEALEKVTSGLKIDIMLVDIRMPEMDGLTLIEKLNEQGIPANVIIVSAYADIPNIRKAMNEGAYDLLVKPIGIDEIEECINRLSNLRKQSIKLSKPSETRQAARINTLVADSPNQKATPSIAYKITKQLQPNQQIKVINRLVENFTLEELTDLKYKVETQEYIEIERQEGREDLAFKVYEELGFDEKKLPLIALERGRVEERIVKRNTSSGDVKDYGIHLYLRWKIGTDKAYYLGPADSLDERTKTLLSLLNYSQSQENLEEAALPDEKDIKPAIDEPENRKLKSPINLRRKSFETR